MTQRPTFSLIVPTRGRPEHLRRFLDSLAATTADPEAVEVVLVVDADDPDSARVTEDRLTLKHVLVEPGLRMGALNRAGYRASSGDYLMLLNDDVVARTRAWDRRVIPCLRSFPDDIVLVHVNDLLFNESLCTFPLVSRTFCELAGGICPPDYVRYRIDDHINDIFNLLAVLEERRMVYLPEVIFEHLNFTGPAGGQRQYECDQAILAEDARRFEAMFSQRKELALKLKEHVETRARLSLTAVRRRKLEAIPDSFAITGPDRLRVERGTTSLCSANTRLTIGLVTADRHADYFRTCIEAIKANTRNFELVVLDHGNARGVHRPRELNRILATTRTDFLVMMDDQALVEPGWADRLLGAMKENVALVTPVHRERKGRPSYGGIVFSPDGSGNHGHILATPHGPRHVLTFCCPIVLMDTAKCRHILFDETYQDYFFDIDYGLRVWEAGWEVVCEPAVVITHLAGGPLPYGSSLIPELFDRDRKVFIGSWMACHRFRRLAEHIGKGFPEIQRMLNLGQEVGRLLGRDLGETKEGFPLRAERLFDEIRSYPLLHYELIQALKSRGMVIPGGETTVKKWGMAQLLRDGVQDKIRKIRICRRERGLPGLLQAVWRRTCERLVTLTRRPGREPGREKKNSTMASRGAMIA